MFKRTVFLFVVVLFVSVAMSFAQNVSENTEESSESSAMQLVYSRADATAKCGSVPNINLNGAPYAPKFQSSVKSYTRFETYGLALMCMQTSLPQYRSNNGIGWVLTADQSQVGFTSERMAYYLGTADGQYKRCHNTVYAIAVAQKQEESWTPTQKQQQTNINVSANANANATAIAKTEVCKPKAMEYVRTDTVRGREFEIYSNGCQEFPREVVAETKAELCPEGTLRNERTGQCVKPEKGDSWWVRGAIAGGGAAGMYAACRIWKFCGTKKVYTNGTIIPTKGRGTDGKEPGITPGTRTRTDGTGRVNTTGSSNGTGTVSTRKRAGTNTFVQQVAPYQSGARTRGSTQAQPNRSYSTNTSGCANLITVQGRRVCAN